MIRKKIFTAFLDEKRMNEIKDSTIVRSNKDFFDWLFDIEPELTQKEIARYAGVSEKSVWTACNGGKLRYGTLKKIAEGVNQDPANAIEAEDRTSELHERRQLDLGPINPWKALTGDLYQNIERLRVEGWERPTHKAVLSPLLIDEVGALINQQYVKSVNNPDLPVYPIWFLQHGLSLNTDQISALEPLEENINALADKKLGFSSSLKSLLNSNDLQAGLDETMVRCEESGLHLLGGLIETPIPFHHNPASVYCDGEGCIKILVLVVASTRFTSVSFDYEKWEQAMPF